MNGFCDGPLNCICLDGWTGDLCSECIPSPNCCEQGVMSTIDFFIRFNNCTADIGGYCMSPGECICRDGYSGDYCDFSQ